MPFETVDEIFALCRKIQEETRHYVCIAVRNITQRELYMTIDINENGWEPGENFDDTYGFFCNGKNRSEYEECKKRLLGLLPE